MSDYTEMVFQELQDRMAAYAAAVEELRNLVDEMEYEICLLEERADEATLRLLRTIRERSPVKRGE